MRWCVVASVLINLSVAGCQRAVEPTYVFRAEVAALSPELQQAIQTELVKHSGTPLHPKLIGNEKVAQPYLDRGAMVFQQRCAGCHGTTGDGNGPAAEQLYPRPRDYRRGIFKFTSTPYGAKPRREDLLHTVRYGARGTSMPEFKLLPGEDLQAVVDHVLVLTHRGELEFALALEADDEDSIDPEKTPELIASIVDQWQKARRETVTPLTQEPTYDEASIERGKKAFLTETAGCFKCHGPDGRGLTAASPENFKDSWGFPTRAADLTAGMFHGGGRPLDIYRRIYAGINGTPMPGFGIKLASEPETLWDLVHYVEYVSSARRREVQAAERHWQPRVFRPAVASRSAEGAAKRSTETSAAAAAKNPR